MRNIWTKHFDYFQGLKALKCHRTKRLICINYRSKWPLQKTFLRSTPPPAWISGVFDPPSRENFQNPIRRGGVDFFWNNPFFPIEYMYIVVQFYSWFMYQFCPMGERRTCHKSMQFFLCFFWRRKNAVNPRGGAKISKARCSYLSVLFVSFFRENLFL